MEQEMAVLSPEDQPEPMMTFEQARLYLGLSEFGLHRVVKRRAKNGCPARRIGPGGHWRFLKSEIDAWTERCGVPVVPARRARKAKPAQREATHDAALD